MMMSILAILASVILGVAGLSALTIDGIEALIITANYTGADGGWKEISIKIPFGELNNMDYFHDRTCRFQSAYCTGF